MEKRTRINFTAAQRTEIWDRWQRGESMHEIARALGRAHSSICYPLKLNGGVRPRPRTRSPRALSLAERECISRGLASGMSFRAIAGELGRSPSTVSREVHRHGGCASYRAHLADKSAWDRAKRPQRCKLADRPDLARRIAQKLKSAWSPEQIAGWLKRAYPEDERYHVSHETIYRSLFIQARGVLKKELLDCLRSQRTVRRSRHSLLKGRNLGNIPDAITIRERPASVEDRAVPGHWEGDLIVGTHGSYIATLVERQTRFLMLAKIDSKDSATVVAALTKQARTLPRELYRSLTWDRGSEMAEHKQFTLATDIQVYFCDPKSPWQRGTNENTNGLLRQYFPKGTDLSVYSQRELDRVARQLNERPRKTLGFQTPAAKFNECVALTS